VFVEEINKRIKIKEKIINNLTFKYLRGNFIEKKKKKKIFLIYSIL